MTKFTEQKKEEWQGNVAKARSIKRSEYAAGPAINKWFLRAYENNIREAIKNKQKPRVLILGATPETRDLVLDYNINLTILDQNQEMVDKMTLLMKNKDSKLETITMGNWLKPPFKDNSFDLVLGDGVCNNIEFNKKSAFIKEVKRILAKGGVMFFREGVLKKEFPISPVKEILKIYRKDFDFPSFFVRLNFFSEISAHNIDEHNFDMGEMFERLQDYKSLFTKEEFDHVMCWRGTIKHSIIEIEKLEEMIKSVFGNAEIINNKESFILSFWPFLKAKKV